MEFTFVNTETSKGWGEWQFRNVEVRNDAVTLARQPIVAETPLGINAVGIDIDDVGVLYVLGPRGGLYTTDANLNAFDRVDAGPFEDPQDVCVTAETIYVLAGGGTRLHALSKAVRQTRWVESLDIDPPRAVTNHGESVFFLHRGDDPSTGTLTRLRSDGTITGSLSTGSLASPVDVATGSAGIAYVLVRPGGDPKLVRVELDSFSDPTEYVTEFQVAGVPTSVDPSCVSVDRNDDLLVGTDVTVREAALFRYRPDSRDFEALPGISTGCWTLESGPTVGTDDVGAWYAITPRGISRLEETWRNRRTLEWYVGGDGSGSSADDSGGSGAGAEGSGARPEGSSSGAEGSGARPEGSSSGPNGSDARPVGYDGSIVRRFDAGSRDVQWHRVTMGLDADGPNKQVALRYYTTETTGEPLDLTALTDSIPDFEHTHVDALAEAGMAGAWDVLERGPSALVEAVADLSPETAERWHARVHDRVVEGSEWRPLGRPNPEDALLADAVGRYLHVKLVLVGSEAVSPEIESFRAYLPRRSYLRHLPDIYREDEQSAAFLERFLSLFESTFVDVETHLETATQFFDPHGVPREYLDWLESWLALETDETWPESARREFLARAPELYTKRGTRTGLLAVLQIYLEHVTVPTNGQVQLTPVDARAASPDTPEFVALLERPDLDCIDDEGTYEAYARLVDAPSGVLVLVHPLPDEHMSAIRRIVDAVTPAHATSRVVPLRPRFELGRNAYLGVNTAVPSAGVVLGRSGLGMDATISERERYSQLEVRSLLGKDTRLS